MADDSFYVGTLLDSRARARAPSVIVNARARWTKLFATVLVAVGCAGGSPGKTSNAGQLICEDQRRALDCTNEVAYQGVVANGDVHVLNLAGAKGAFADTALRNIDQAVERYVASQTRLCRDYNACTIKQEEYNAEAREARARLNGIAPMIEKAQSTGGEERIVAAERILQQVTGVAPTPLAVRIAISAQLPAALGGRELVVPANYPLPTGSRIAFQFEIDGGPGYVYLFQVGSDQKVSVMFPDDRIEVKNPVGGASRVRIPEHGQRFEVDDKGLGNENLYVVVSTKPLTSLEQSLRKFASGKVEDLKQDPLLADLALIQPGTLPKECAEKTRDVRLVSDAPSPSSGDPRCARTRGVVLAREAPKPNEAATQSLEARAKAGDDVIAKVFRFQHVTPESYRAKLDEYNAPTAAGERKRGISIEN